MLVIMVMLNADGGADADAYAVADEGPNMFSGDRCGNQGSREEMPG